MIRPSAAEAAAMLNEITEILLESNDLAAEEARQERQAELKEATEPSDWHERPRTYAKLDCGCQWQCSRYAYGYAVAPRWTEECDRHSGLDAHMEEE